MFTYAMTCVVVCGGILIYLVGLWDTTVSLVSGAFMHSVPELRNWRGLKKSLLTTALGLALLVLADLSFRFACGKPDEAVWAPATACLLIIPCIVVLVAYLFQKSRDRQARDCIHVGTMVEAAAYGLFSMYDAKGGLPDGLPPLKEAGNENSPLFRSWNGISFFDEVMEQGRVYLDRDERKAFLAMAEAKLSEEREKVSSDRADAARELLDGPIGTSGPGFVVSLYAHGQVVVRGDDVLTEDDAIGKAKSIPMHQVDWEEEYQDMETFPIPQKEES